MLHVAHLTAHTYIGLGTHMALYPPVVVPAPVPHVAMDTLLGLTLGAKWSKKVIGPFGFQFIGKGNDSGKIIPHIAIPPPSVLVPLVIGFGSSKPMFSASTVKTDAGPVAAVAIPWNFVSFNQACNDPCNYPSDMVISPNTVAVGLTLGDFIGGLINIVVDCAVSALANKLGGDVAAGLMKHIGGRIASAFLREFTGEMTEAFGREAAERMALEAGQNIVERALPQFIQESIGKLLDPVIGSGVDTVYGAIGAPNAEDIGTETGNVIDGTPNTTPTEKAMTTNQPGAAPIYSAE